MRTLLIAVCSMLFLVSCVPTKTYFDPNKDFLDIKQGPTSQVYSVEPIKINIDEAFLNLSEKLDCNGYPLIFPTGVLISKVFEKDKTSDLSLKLIQTSAEWSLNDYDGTKCFHAADYEMMVVFEKNGEEDYIPVRTKGCANRGWPFAGRFAIEKAVYKLHKIAEAKVKD